MEITPSILTDNYEEFEKQIKLAETFVDEIDIDFIDGKFIPQKTISIDEILEIETSLMRHLHLMSINPQEQIKKALNFGIRSVIVHTEADLEWLNFDELTLQVGIALNPETPVTVIQQHLSTLSLVQIMTVTPGAQGQGLETEALKKVEELRALGYKGEIKADGAVNAEDITKIENAGFDSVTVGSAIWQSNNPEEAYKELQSIVQNN